MPVEAMDVSDRKRSLFDLISSGNYQLIGEYGNEVKHYLPRLTFTALYYSPSLIKELYFFSEVNRVESYLDLEYDEIEGIIDFTSKSNSTETIILNSSQNSSYSKDLSSYSNDILEEFESISPIEQLRKIVEELYQLSEIFYYNIPDEHIIIPEDLLAKIKSEESKGPAKKNNKNIERFEERKKKKMQKITQQCKLKWLMNAASSLPILSSPLYTHILCEIIPCIPLVYPYKNQDEEKPSLSIPVRLFYFL